MSTERTIACTVWPTKNESVALHPSGICEGGANPVSDPKNRTNTPVDDVERRILDISFQPLPYLLYRVEMNLLLPL